MAQTLGSEMRDGSNSAPVKLFRGYDTVSRGILTASAVEGDWENTGVSSAVRVQVCESLSELAEALDIDASLNVSYLKAVDVTAKMEFARKLNVTARSVSIVVYAKHGLGTWDATDVKLRTGQGAPKAPTDDKSAAAFVKTYGDSFIKSVTLGGEYFAVYIFNTETREQQQNLAASLKTDVVSGVTVKAEAQVKLNNFLKTTKTNWTLKQDMTGITNPDFPDQDKLIPFALGFSKLPLDGAVVTNIKVTGYEDVDGFGEGFDTVVDNRDYFLDRRTGLLPKHGRLTAVSNQIEWLKRIYQRYGYKGDTALAAFADKVEADLAAIDKQVRDWRLNAARAFKAPDLPSLKEGEPVLNFEERTSPAWGGEAPGPWTVDSVGDLIRNRTRLKSIQLASGLHDGKEMLGRLVLEYSSDKRSWTESHGNGDVKTWQQKLDLEEGQFPTWFQVHHGSLVDRLKIQLSDGRITESGGPSGGNVVWEVPKDCVFVGFAGRSGGVIDQIEIRCAKLNPARMVNYA